MAREHVLRVFRGGEVPELDVVLARRACEDVLCGWVEEDLADTPCGGADAEDGVKILGLPLFLSPIVEGISRIDLPEEDVPVLAARSDDAVVMGRPVGVEDGCGVSSS